MAGAQSSRAQAYWAALLVFQLSLLNSKRRAYRRGHSTSDGIWICLCIWTWHLWIQSTNFLVHRSAQRSVLRVVSLHVCQKDIHPARTIPINLEAGGAHCVVLLNDVLRPSNGCLLELGISPIRAGPWSSNVDTVVIEHQVRVGDVQSSADVHQLVEVHDRGLEAPTEAVIEEPIPAREPRPCGQDRLWLGLCCVWRGSPLIAVGFLTPRIAQ